MSSVHYEFVSTSSTGWVHSRTCDMCKTKVERKGRPPQNENEGGTTQSFDDDAFVGWSHFEQRVAGDGLGRVYDLCRACTGVFLDAAAQLGLPDPGAAGGVTTVYLDSFGQPVDDPQELGGRLACIWRAEGKIGIRPCRRVRGHTGECSGAWEPGYRDCPVCGTPDRWHSIHADEHPPLLFTRSALEHHAVQEHGCGRDAAGRWYRLVDGSSYNTVNTAGWSSAEAMLEWLAQRLGPQMPYNTDNTGGV